MRFLFLKNLLANFESRNNYPRQGSGYNNNNNNRQSRTSQSNNGNGEENGYADGRKRNPIDFQDFYFRFRLDYSSNNSNNSRKISNEKESVLTHQGSDEVFLATDTSPHESPDDKPTTRQPIRNWADCPIDDSGVDTSPPPTVNRTSTNHDTDNFQVETKISFELSNHCFSSRQLRKINLVRINNNNNIHHLDRIIMAIETITIKHHHLILNNHIWHLFHCT